jgi:hypothetical protein
MLVEVEWRRGVVLGMVLCFFEVARMSVYLGMLLWLL